MKRGKLGLRLLGTAVGTFAIVAVLTLTPTGAAFTSSLVADSSPSGSSSHLSLKYRSVAVGGDCLDYGKGAPCNVCELSGTMTNSNGVTVDAVCSDVLTAVGAKQSWHAYYYKSSSLDSGGININETSGTLYSGQSLQFIFGIEFGCAVPYNPEIVKIVGPSNTVEIGYGGCG